LATGCPKKEPLGRQSTALTTGCPKKVAARASIDRIGDRLPKKSSRSGVNRPHWRPVAPKKTAARASIDRIGDRLPKKSSRSGVNRPHWRPVAPKKQPLGRQSTALATGCKKKAAAQVLIGLISISPLTDPKIKTC
jgi:hypothetical protein